MANPFDKFLTVEDTHHIQVVNWVKKNLPDIIFAHVPNEGNKTPFERYKYVLMGSLTGCPDFVFFHPKYSEVVEGEKPYRKLLYHGLLIELKAPDHNRIVKSGKMVGKIVKTKGKVSEKQALLIDRLNKVKYKAVAAFGSDEAIKIIKEYFCC